ncbi:hypothetical protein [Aureibacter tunicatorum]|uniref:Uncharacterized protein n=1 Tax=Aureibacter tunicatorum TaxID=866807 RepID=A0AAE3XR33_9BACT|nr:hypothetical protein [Aureibacter tunicatorum]MDR6239884.1 hypothetical protein [Aureibacter tunicatorum]BDD04359.1 hypothetical protein AUTU_18420 [Aureibacter tunicatorum]
MLKQQIELKNNERKIAKRANSLSISPPSIPLESFPVQCARVLVGQEEWYGNKLTKSIAGKRRFVRTNIRKAILIPDTQGYPHLTIDIDDSTFERKKGTVSLSISHMHYSPSKYGKRLLFVESKTTGVFEAINPTPEDLHLIKTANNWLKKSKLGLSIAEPEFHPLQDSASTTLLPSLTFSPAEDSLETTSHSMPNLDLLTIDVPTPPHDTSLPSSTDSSPTPAKKKKKKKKKPVAGSEFEIDETLRLEESVKFANILDHFQVAKLEDLSTEHVDFLVDHEMKMVGHIASKATRLQDMIAARGKEFNNEIARYFISTRKLGKRKNDLEFLSSFFDKLHTSILPEFNAYTLVDLIPESLHKTWHANKDEQALFDFCLKVTSKVYELMLCQLRCNEAKDRLIALQLIIKELLPEYKSSYFEKLFLYYEMKRANLMKDPASVEFICSLMYNPVLMDSEADQQEAMWDGHFTEMSECVETTSKAVMTTIKHHPLPLERKLRAMRFPTFDTVLASASFSGDQLLRWNEETNMTFSTLIALAKDVEKERSTPLEAISQATGKSRKMASSSPRAKKK